MIIYITTNLINGKKYIGSHAGSNSKYLGSGTYLLKAIKKYGRENFIRETLAEVDNLEMMKELEVYYIEYFNAYKSPLFYNNTIYAAGITKYPEDKIINVVNANKGNQYNKGRIWSEGSKRKSSITHTGFKLTDEQKIKLTLSKIGNRCAIKKVNQLDLEGNIIKEWECIKDAAKSFGSKTGTNIVAVCKKRKKTAYGFKWEYNND